MVKGTKTKVGKLLNTLHKLNATIIVSEADRESFSRRDNSQAVSIDVMNVETVRYHFQDKPDSRTSQKVRLTAWAYPDDYSDEQFMFSATFPISTEDLPVVYEEINRRAAL